MLALEISKRNKPPMTIGNPSPVIRNPVQPIMGKDILASGLAYITDLFIGNFRKRHFFPDTESMFMEIEPAIRFSCHGSMQFFNCLLLGNSGKITNQPFGVIIQKLKYPGIVLTFYNEAGMVFQRNAEANFTIIKP